MTTLHGPTISLVGLRVLFAGSGAFGEPTLRHLVELGASVEHVYTQPDKPAGRGNKLTPTPIAVVARSLGLPVTATPDVNALELPPADVLVVIAFGQKLSPAVIDHARLGAINLHASRLPLYRGAAPIHWAVIDGRPTTGNSVIRLAQRMDAGAVLAMSELAVDPIETTGELHDRLALDGATLVAQVLADLRDNTATETEQDHDRATRALKLSRESAALDWTRDATALANQIRGMQPWPGCRVRLLDEHGDELDRLTLVRARPLANAPPSSAQPGTIRSDGLVACGTGALEVVELHPDGKRPLSINAYRNGGRWRVGARLESSR